MRQVILMIAVVIGLSGLAADKKSEIVFNSPKAKAAIEKEIRKRANKPTGELTKADLEKVTMLVIKVTEVSDVRIMAKLTQLEVLDLFGNQLTDVSALAGLTKLRFLNLRNNQLTDTSSLVGLAQVERLALGLNNITDISGLAGLKQLTQLYLSGNRLTDKQLEHLAGLKQLKVLDLRLNPKLTKDQIDKLRKVLPKCKIFSNAEK